MEIIHISDGRYSEYEELLLERDRYRKEAEQYMKLYIHEFGDKITAVFKQEIACIEKKKMLSYCIQYYNRGESVDIKNVVDQVKSEMLDYQKQLNQMVSDNIACKFLSSIPEADALKIRHLYRQLARKLHPDLNPLTEENETLKDLWHRTVTAYQCNDLKELEETEILIELAIASLGEGKLEITIPDISERIQKIKDEIDNIKNTDPYRYKYILRDPVLMAEKKDKLDKELEEYMEYANQLDKQLKQFIVEGGTFIWQN